MKYGVIDIGSNSVRLMIFENGKSLFKLVTTTRLAKGMSGNGNLSVQSMQNTVLAIEKYVQNAKKQCVDKLYCFATSAVRTAKNGVAFVGEILDKTGVKVDVVSEEVEAEIGYLGALDGKDGGIIDIGGGSTEIQVAQNQVKVYGKSLPIGAVRLTDICGQENEKLKRYIAEKIVLYGQVPKCEFYAIGGTATTVASILQEMEAYDFNKVDGYEVGKKELSELADRLSVMTVEERKKIVGLQVERADIISSGVTLLKMLVDYLGVEKIYISDKDNLEGYLKWVNYD